MHSPTKPIPLAPAATAHDSARTPWLRHFCLLGPVAGCTVLALVLALRAMPLPGPARIVYALAVAVNVGLLALSSWGGILGALVAVAKRLRPGGWGPVLRPPTGQARTAVLLPVCEEDAARVFAAAGVMADEIANAGRLGTADLFVLSDTRSEAGAAAEMAAHRRLLASRGPAGPAVHYRRRTENHGRKAGNIAEFCARWGASYDFMVVLDADSLMTGPAIARLVGAMEANPNAGLVQSMCYPVGRTTLFARWQQFAARLYGPLLAEGAAFWQGPRGSYWGHNAILRIAAFTAHCGLPSLPGRAPFGGEILCHDTVEAALLLRAGWDVWMLPAGPGGQHEGSWEETPTNLVDHLDRDRRWCQGNLQHGRVLGTDGLRLASFVHLGQGILHYLSAPLFVAWLVLSRLAGGHPGHAADTALLAIVLLLMFLPRVLALAAVLADREASAGFGGRHRLLASAVLDQVLGLLSGPVSLVMYTVFVGTTLAGRVVRWDAQARSDRGLGWREAWARLWLPLSLAIAVATAMPVATALLMPGLVLGLPLAVWSSRRGAGEMARRLGLFLTPEEVRVPPELHALAAAQEALNGGAAPDGMVTPALPEGAGLPVLPQVLRQGRARPARPARQVAFG